MAGKIYPLLLEAPVMDNIWGGTRLKTEYGCQTDKAIAAEAWMLSCHQKGSCTVKNGPLKGRSLPDVLTQWGSEALGAKAAAFPYFPLLIKLIDAKDTLSIQVHPDDDYAMRVEGEFGKTEMWYVVDCDPGATLIYGFTQSLTKEEFRRRIDDNTLPQVCNYVPVKPGDVFFIEAGTLHAIGSGILIAEVQQNSNTTYRVSDFGRLGADGKPRELHKDKAVDVTATVPPTRPYGAVGEIRDIPGGQIRELASCDLFSARLLTVTDTVTLTQPDTFQHLLVLSGTGTVTCGEDALPVHKGDSVFVPAGMTAVAAGDMQLLYSFV